MYTIDKANAAAIAGAEAVRRSPYALRYHVAPRCGWINDPNGLCFSNGRYHAFYQYYPYEPKWGPMHWGHASSADLAHWRHEPVALAPDQPYEEGCYSGSAVDDNGVLTLIYTADHKHRPIPEAQCIARSFDGGMTFVKSPLNPVIPAPPEGCTFDFRDPKVWKQDGRWHMVVGSSHDGNGCGTLFVSDDLEHWMYRGIMCESDGRLGNMWECPSFCTVDGQDILIVSPMEMEGHKNIAMFGRFDCAAGRMTIDHWQELDLGQDFYAAQVLYDGERTLLMAWMDMWGREHPTEADGWAGALTIPRLLSVRNGKLLQTPAPELEQLRSEMLLDTDDKAAVRAIDSDCLELRITFGSKPAAFTLGDDNETLFVITVKENEAAISVPDGYTRTAKLDFSNGAPELRVFIDRCSAECFLNGGEVCFTQRAYPHKNRFRCDLTGDVRHVTAWQLSDAFEENEC